MDFYLKSNPNMWIWISKLFLLKIWIWIINLIQIFGFELDLDWITQNPIHDHPYYQG